MNIIGINAFHGDSAACLLVDGELRAAAEEERFRRIKHWAGFPGEAIKFCLQEARLTLSDIDVIAINTDNNAAIKQKLHFLVSGQASWSLIKEKLLIRKKRMGIEEYLQHELPGQTFIGKIEWVEHHQCHLASAFFASPYDEAVVVSIDGFGDFSSAAWAIGLGHNITVKDRVYFPHSLGIFYSALTQFLGFPNYGDEYKVMGLAPYGKNHFAKEMDEILLQANNGLFTLNTDYFIHQRQPVAHQWDGSLPQISTLFSEKLITLLGSKRQQMDELSQRHKDIAYSVQNAYERAFFHLINHAQQQTGSSNIAIAGGCGMNSVANGKIATHSKFTSSYIQAAAGDAGGALGAAMIAGQRYGISSSPQTAMPHAYWGPRYSDDEIKSIVVENTEQFTQQNCQIVHTKSEGQLYQTVVDCMVNGGVVGWFQGAMEWGPRALGNRSIICDPRRDDMKDILNHKIKRRESFRPFAPSILRDQVNDWFEIDDDVPFMMKVFPIKVEKRHLLPAVTHVDGSGRLQTVTPKNNPRYYALISHFFDRTGVPIVLNTSFNENEPIVCQPQEAIDCFLRSKMDMLVLGSTIVSRI